MYLLYTVLMTVNMYVNKMLFSSNPQLTVLQFTFVRAVSSVLLSLLTGIGNLKRELFDSIGSDVVPSLIFRCLQGTLSVLITFTSIKYFDVSTVGVVCSLTPFFVCLLAYFVLGEKLRRGD